MYCRMLARMVACCSGLPKTLREKHRSRQAPSPSSLTIVQGLPGGGGGDGGGQDEYGGGTVP